MPEKRDKVLDPIHWMSRDPFPVRWVHSLLRKLGIRYVTFTGEEKQLWEAAMRNAPIAFRWLGDSLSLADLDAKYGKFHQWVEARKEYREGDKI